MPVIPAFKRLGQENRGFKGRDWKLRSVIEHLSSRNKTLGSNSTTIHTQFKASLATQLRSRGLYTSVVEHLTAQYEQELWGRGSGRYPQSQH